jgi:subtilisin family serine protease
MTRARVLALVAWLALVAGTAFAAGPLDRKADPALRVAVSEWAEAQRLGTSAAGEAARRALLDGAGYYRLRREPGLDEPLVPTFVRLSDPAAQGALEAQGARVQARVGDIVVAQLPISRVAAIAALPDVSAKEMAGTAAPFLNASRAASHVDEVHAGTGLDRAYQGAGVVVGVLDSGIDYTHPDFKTAGGATRLKGLFDYSSGLGGREWSIGSIDSATSTEYDGHLSGGHGTHVAGTAAGGGMLNAAYRGVAPLADIVFVKGMRDSASGTGFNTADIVAGVQYIFNKARTLGKPCVVNLSLGGQDGPHDGTSLYEQAFDGLTHPGNIIVVSAGNANGDYVHGGYDVPSGTTYPESNETAWYIYPGTSQAIVDAWYPSSGNIRFGVAVYAIGSYGTPLALTNPIGPGTSASNVTVTDGATNYGRVTIDATTTSDVYNG